MVRRRRHRYLREVAIRRLIGVARYVTEISSSGRSNGL